MMYIVINQLSCRYWIFIFSWSFIIAMITLGFLIWNFNIFMMNTNFEGETVDITGTGLISLVGITMGFIAFAMWGATWGADCYTASPYCKEKWAREWDRR